MEKIVLNIMHLVSQPFNTILPYLFVIFVVASLGWIAVAITKRFTSEKTNLIIVITILVGLTVLVILSVSRGNFLGIEDVCDPNNIRPGFVCPITL